MQEETKEETKKEPTDLQIVTGDGIRFKDKNGKEHYLSPLDLTDLRDYERKLGSLRTLNAENSKFDDVLFLLWLSLRKEGLTQDEIERRNWKLTEDGVGRMFDFRNLKQLNLWIVELLKISGLDTQANPTNPVRPPVNG